MMRKRINDNWIFQKKGSDPVYVDLPFDAMIHETRDASCFNGINTGYFPGGEYSYKRIIELSEDLIKDKNVSLHFECVYQKASVKVNRKEAAYHSYGFTPFDVDISPYVHAGNNEIEVLVDNSLEPNCRWYSGSGIFRDVFLDIREQIRVEKLRIETISIDSAIVRIDSDADELEILDADGHSLIKTVPGEIRIADGKLWNSESPYLYTCIARKGKDEIRNTFGIRKMEWSAEKGLLINGEEVLLRGACIHHDHGILGACEYREAEERRIRILKENGFNAIRMAHNPASAILMDICDSMGMYVMNEAYDGWYTPKTYHDHSRSFENDWKEDMTAMIEASYNHPCIIMYSIGNEVSETAENKGVEVCKKLTGFVHSLDHTRPVTAGINVLLNVYARMGIGVYKEKGEYKAEPLRNNKTYKEKKTGSAFFNAVAQKLGDLLFFMSRGSKGDKAVAGAAKALDIIGYNYGSGRYDEDARKHPERIMVGSETMVRDLPYNWERVKKYPALIGDFVWAGWDYLGEACIGDWTYHSYEGLPLLAGQGMIDITGKPLASMAFMQTVWGLRDKPFIAVRPLNHASEKPSTGSWQFTNAIDSWNWEGYEGTKAIVEVYSPGEKVRLILNKKQVGMKKLNHYKAVFSVVYENGTLIAEALDENGNVICIHSLISGEKETVLSIRPEKNIVLAGELFYVPIEFTDGHGILKPYVEEKIELNVQGGTLMGFGSALCKSDELFDKTYHVSYRGRALAVIRADDEKKVIIEATSKSYGKACVEIEVKK